MKKRLIPHCTGSYTGVFCPTVSGPWAKYYDASGKFIDMGDVEPMPPVRSALDRIADSLEFFRNQATAPALPG